MGKGIRRRRRGRLGVHAHFVRAGLVVEFMRAAGNPERRLVERAMDVPYQLLKAARAALGMTNLELARKAGVSKRTLVRIEALQSVSLESRQRVKAVFEAEGVLFLPPREGHGPGLFVADRLVKEPDGRNRDRSSPPVGGTEPAD